MSGEAEESCSSVAHEVFLETEEELKQGIDRFWAGKLEAAVKILGDVLESRSQHFGEFAIECAKAHYYYGLTMVELAKANSDVFAGKNDGGDDDAQQAQEASPQQAGQAGQAGTSSAPGTGEQTESEKKEDDGGAVDELQCAWEALEVAKISYTEDGVEKHRLELADVHTVLGDVQTELYDTEAAVSEYNTAVEHLKQAGRPMPRRLSEVYYKQCLAMELADKNRGALESCENAIAQLNQEIQRIKTENQGESSRSQEEVQKEVKGLEEIVSDLQNKVSDIQDALKNEEEIKTMLVEFFKKGVDAGAGGLGNGDQKAPQSEPVQDLGVVGRGKKKIQLEPTGGGGQADDDKSYNGKRRTDDQEGSEDAKKRKTTC